MELTEEMASNTNNVCDANVHNSVVSENIQKPVAQKKFYNTVFATKMRNRKMEEKLNKIDSTEVLTSCKPMSVDITRLSPKVVPKIISTIEHRNRKRKRFQWKLGKTTKKKKARDKDKNKDKNKDKDNNILSLNQQQENNKVIDEHPATAIQNLETKHTALDQEKLVGAGNSDVVEKDYTQRRKSSRLVTPMTFFDEKWDYEPKPDPGPVPEEIFSCRRTEIFIGKLNTKEARIMNIEKILKEENEPDMQNKNDIDKDNVKCVVEKNEKNKDLVNKKLITNDESQIIEENTSDTIVGTLDKKEILTHNSEKELQKITNTKENKKVENTSCRRVLPFKGKVLRKSSVDLHESAQLSVSDNEENIKANALNENFDKNNSDKLDCSDFGLQNMNKKVDSVLINMDDKIISNLKNVTTKLNSDDKSVTNIKTELESLNDKINSKPIPTPESVIKKAGKYADDASKKLDNQSDKLDKKELLNSSNKAETKIELKQSPDSCAGKEIWSCRRTELYYGKNYPQCSRTLPFKRPANKINNIQVQTNVDSHNDSSSLLETASGKLHLSETEQNVEINNTSSLADQGKEIENIISNATISVDTSSKSNSPLPNGEWKFRRKRQKINSEGDIEVEESNPSKKLKIKSPSKSPRNKKVTSEQLKSSEKTICSLLSLNCSKHAHYHHTHKCSVPIKMEFDAYVLLTKLEDMTDPQIIKFLKKTDVTYKIKQDIPSPMKSNINGYESNELVASEAQVSLIEQVTQDDSQNVNAMQIDQDAQNLDTVESNSDFNQQTETTSISESSSTESLIKPKTRKRSTIQSSSSESSVDWNAVLYSKRNTRPVNYVENFSDSDSSDVSSSASTSKTRLQNRTRMKINSISDRDDNDFEVEAFSHVGQRKRILSEETNSSMNSAETNIRLTRSKSRNQVRLDGSNKESENTFERTLQSRLSTSQNEIDKLSETDDAIVDNKMEETATNTLVNQGSNLNVCKTPIIRNNQCEFNNNTVTSELRSVRHLRTPSVNQETQEQSDHILSTPKTVKKNNIVTSGRKSRASKVVDAFDTSQPTQSSPSRIDAENSVSDSGSNIPVKSGKQVKNNLLSEFSKTSYQEFSVDPVTAAKDVSIKDLKVQLIRLETVCGSYMDYSASEIEILTRKYIDLLMNSNFTCDTWRTPINYHRPANFDNQSNEEIDNSDCISDMDSQTYDIQYNELEDTKPSIEQLNINTEITNETSNPNIELNYSNSSQLTPLESAIATLIGNEPEAEGHAKVTNISGIFNATSSEKNNEHNNVASSSKLANINRESENLNASESQAYKKTICVDGIIMFTCLMCNKVFPNETIFKDHVNQEHEKDNETVVTETVVTTDTNVIAAQKPVEKLRVAKESASATSSGKKHNQKIKKKYRCSNSLKCSICLVTFDTKELLFDHIMTHNEQELQEAYKTAKAQAKLQEAELSSSSNPEKSDKDQQKQETNNKKKDKSKRKKSSDSSMRSSIESEGNIDEQVNISNVPVVTVSDEIVNDKPITICTCHAHETTNQDLQIEMVLLCKVCHVIFRRRDCFEVHFRNNLECKRNRTNNTKVPKLFCSGCPCIIDGLPDMRIHLEMHAKRNSQGTVTFICNICKVAFFGVGGIFYQHWYQHTKSPNFVASRYSFPKLSVVSVLEDSTGPMIASKSQEGFFYIAEHVCRDCRLPFTSEPELLKHQKVPCQSIIVRPEGVDGNRLQMFKLICDLCKKYYLSKENFDRHCTERNHLKTPMIKFSRLPINANEEAFVCSLCRAVNKSLDEMKEHWKRIHSPIMELYTCKTCNVIPSNDVTNYTYEKFERHCHLIHKSEVITCLVYYVIAPYVCDLCKFGFETEESMKEHQVIHKKSTQGTLPLTPSTAIRPLPMESQTFWVADKNVAPDGGRQIHPVYVQYPSSNIANRTVSIPANAVPLDAQSQQQLQIRQPNLTVGGIASTNIVTNKVPPTNSTTIRTISPEVNTMLRNILSLQQIAAQSRASKQTPSLNASNVETILIDSRSNSPVSDSVPAATVTRDNSNSNSGNTAGDSRNPYMTIVNADFEKMLGSNTSNKTNVPINETLNSNTENSHSTNQSTVVPNADPLTEAEPFEVVLVNDDLSESSNGDAVSGNTNKSSETNDSVLNQQQIQQQTSDINEGSSTKSFLRVRSIAELQSMKIHLCSICGLSFETLHAFELHSQEHELQENSKEVGRSTPVQMISPRVAQNKESINDTQNLLFSQMRQKYAILTPSVNTVPEENSMLSTVGASNQLQQQQLQQEQQQQNYWFASCNGVNAINQSSVNFSNTYSVNRLHPQATTDRPSHNTNNLTATVNTGFTSRGPPPPYPTNSATITPVRSGAIQLPERNATSSGTPTSKRPSGAATRIPQQSLPSFESLNEHRQIQNTIGLSPLPRLLPLPTENPQQQQLQFQGKTYSRLSNNMSFGSPNLQPTQQIQQKNFHTCKFPNCTYRSEHINLVRLHERNHLLNTPITPTSTNQQAQQQRLPGKHVSVIQMPERTRHPLPTHRQILPSNTDKRFVCRLCNIICSSKNELLEHVAGTHSVPKNQVCCYICDYCPTPLIFETEELLRKHMNSNHNHSCGLCHKRYPSKEDLLLHMEVHARST